MNNWKYHSKVCSDERGCGKPKLLTAFMSIHENLTHRDPPDPKGFSNLCFACVKKNTALKKGKARGRTGRPRKDGSPVANPGRLKTARKALSAQLRDGTANQRPCDYCGHTTAKPFFVGLGSDAETVIWLCDAHKRKAREVRQCSTCLKWMSKRNVHAKAGSSCYSCRKLAQVPKEQRRKQIKSESICFHCDRKTLRYPIDFHDDNYCLACHAIYQKNLRRSNTILKGGRPDNIWDELCPGVPVPKNVDVEWYIALSDEEKIEQQSRWTFIARRNERRVQDAKEVQEENRNYNDGMTRKSEE